MTTEVATCDQCGRELREAVILGPMHVGPNCAAKLVRKSVGVVTAMAKEAEADRQRELRYAREREERRRALEQRKREWLQATYGVDSMDAAAEKSGKEWLTVFNEFFTWESEHGH
ncbi:hypothetical protein ACWGQ5_43200 [Streptomyces sp. NPDC055722]